MARDWRIQYEGAVYHVMCRGVGGNEIFSQPQDYLRFEDYIELAVERFNLTIYAYTLMTNHYHLFLCTHEANLSRAIQWLQSSYGMYYNLKHRKRGHLFQGRFKSIVIEDESYFLGLSGYIHLNPVRAGIVKNLEEYQWSSYRDYVGTRRVHKWVEPNAVLKMFGGEKDNRAEEYRQWLLTRAGKEKEILNNVRYGIILGSDRFVEWIREKFGKGKEMEEEIPVMKQIRAEVEIGKVIEAIKKVFGVSDKEIQEGVGRKRER
ncbi:MAG: transposase [bacterium]